ncbi:hypothetical protein B9Z55_014497 [Caenorhabditis nigoni]|uniref:Uncharacterized protein n=3 Tax=Caenorhabditis nigoni TaxID=1611254 RepID=A0A2G5U639_9PELO|nr:hypothetical protein B9Z55_014497 [Caenorhabditis nigoni]
MMEEETKYNCEMFPKQFVCPDWCSRLNRYAEKYTEFLKFEERIWQDIVQFIILAIIPTTIMGYIWWRIKKALKLRREKLKKKRHELKMRFLKTPKLKQSRIKRKDTFENAPSSVKERPIRDGIIYTFKNNPELEQLYLEYRKKGITEDMGDTATSRYKYYDSIELPAVYQDIEYYDDKPFIEVKKLENDPVFVDECVALDWEIKTPYRKIPTPDTMMDQAQLKENETII